VLIFTPGKKLAGLRVLDDWIHPGKEVTPTENALKSGWGCSFDPLWINVCG